MVYHSIGFSYLTTIDATKDSDETQSPRDCDEARSFIYRGEFSQDESDLGAASEPHTLVVGYQER